MMMKKQHYFTFVIFFVLILVLAGGCNSEVKVSSTTSSTTTEEALIQKTNATTTKTPTTTTATASTSSTVTTSTSPTPNTTLYYPTTSTTTTTTSITTYPPSTNPYQIIVDAFCALRPDSVPSHLLDENPVKQPGDFDMNSYFTVLTHLSMEPGYVLDYLFTGGTGFGGRPLIYVRKAQDAPFTTYEQYEAAQASATKIENDYDFIGFVMYGATGELGNKVKIDGTPEGYFEYVLLQIMGGQFYLIWHANYDDATIICEKNSAEKTVKECIKGLGIELMSVVSEGGRSYTEFMAKAKFIDFEPMVVISEDTVTVKVVIFTKWGGFIQYAFTINKEYPHSILKVTTRTLVVYQCGVSF
jgi:hypothetical protein